MHAAVMVRDLLIRLLRFLSLFLLFFVGLLWSFRDSPNSRGMIIVSAVGGLVYLLLARQFVRVVDANTQSRSVIGRVLMLGVFLSLAVLNIVVWILLRRILDSPIFQ
jgi:hypothetical protein